MSGEQNKALPPGSPELPERDGFGRARRRSRPKQALALSPRLQRRVSGHAQRLVDALKSDPDPELNTALENERAAVRVELIRYVRNAFPLRRGRPPDPRLDQARAWHEAGMKVTEILRKQIPDFDKRDVYEQMLLQKGMHKGFARRRQPGRKAGPHNTRRFRPTTE